VSSRIDIPAVCHIGGGSKKTESREEVDQWTLEGGGSVCRKGGDVPFLQRIPVIPKGRGSSGDRARHSCY
jgi:hypothetical protein